MIILGEPEDTGIYYYAESDEAFKLHQAGFIPKYKAEDGGMYFKRTKKLLKFLNKIDEEL